MLCVCVSCRVRTVAGAGFSIQGAAMRKGQRTQYVTIFE